MQTLKVNQMLAQLQCCDLEQSQTHRKHLNPERILLDRKKEMKTKNQSTNMNKLVENDEEERKG